MYTDSITVRSSSGCCGQMDRIPRQGPSNDKLPVVKFVPSGLWSWYCSIQIKMKPSKCSSLKLLQQQPHKSNCQKKNTEFMENPKLLCPVGLLCLNKCLLNISYITNCECPSFTSACKESFSLKYFWKRLGVLEIAVLSILTMAWIEVLMCPQRYPSGLDICPFLFPHSHCHQEVLKDPGWNTCQYPSQKLSSPPHSAE